MVFKVVDSQSKTNLDQTQTYCMDFTLHSKHNRNGLQHVTATLLICCLYVTCCLDCRSISNKSVIIWKNRVNHLEQISGCLPNHPPSAHRLYLGSGRGVCCMAPLAPNVFAHSGSRFPVGELEPSESSQKKSAAHRAHIKPK